MFLDYLKSKEVLAVFHYAPLHQSKMGKQFAVHQRDCPVSVDVSERIVRLPFFNMGVELQEYVVSTIKAFPLWKS